MQSYHFIKYNSKTNKNYLEGYASRQSIICFDLEDSLEDSIQKDIHRRILRKILTEIAPNISCLKIGIRINSQKSEYIKDIKTINGISLNTILIPKVEDSDQIQRVISLLNSNNVQFEKIIPIIESKKGLINLADIIDFPNKIFDVGFGHCDYNLDIGAFPFFHQDTYQYWKWVLKFKEVLKPHKINFINSCFLNLGDLKSFQKILIKLQTIFGNECGQFVLTSQQKNIIVQRSFDENKCNKLVLNHRYKITPPTTLASDVIDHYIKRKNGKSFVVTDSLNIISPQEFRSAQNFIKSESLDKIDLTFVGGCFPVQHNILFEDLFHQILKREVEQNNKKLNINIIRYERFANVLEKIKTQHSQQSIKILVFHIRPEPFLRLVKFYYKYIDNKGNIKRSLNVPFLNILNPEKYDILITERVIQFLTNKKKGVGRKILINLNYFVGWLLGNYSFASKRYLVLTKKVIDFCRDQQIIPVILGPAYRNESIIEPILCSKLNRFMEEKIKHSGNDYLNCIDSKDYNQSIFFNANGIHASNEFHDFISKELLIEINKYFS